MRASQAAFWDEVESTGVVLAKETETVLTIEAGVGEEVTGTVEVKIEVAADTVACNEELDAGATAVALAAW